MSVSDVEELTQSLVSQNLPAPEPSFLSPILAAASQRPTPLPALTATAKIRLLNADITKAGVLDQRRTKSLPLQANDVALPETKLSWDVVVQVVDVQDLAQSKWEQIENLESERKREFTRGRQIVRIPPTTSQTESDVSSSATSTAPLPIPVNQTKSFGPFKLHLQDFRGQSIYGFELKKIDQIGMPGNAGSTTSIGCKILLKTGCIVARGVVQLEPATTMVLGGKIDHLERTWRLGREPTLRQALGGVHSQNIE